jgi:hypothetical protein
VVRNDDDEVEPTLMPGKRTQQEHNEDAAAAARLDQDDAAVRAALGLGHWPIVPDR